MTLRAALLLLSLAAMTPAAPAWGAPPDGAAAKAQATVRVQADLVRASRGERSLDPALRGVADELRATPYQRFERLGGAGWSTRVGEEHQDTLGRGVSLSVTVQKADADGAVFVVEVFRSGSRISRTQIDRPYGKAHLIGVGKDGEANLLVPVVVER